MSILETSFPSIYKFLSNLFNLLAVDELFLVLWPRTGNPAACLIPAYEPIALFNLMSSLTFCFKWPSTDISDNSLLMAIIWGSVSSFIRIMG